MDIYIYLYTHTYIFFRERGRERNIDVREKHQLPLVHTLSRDQTHNLVCYWLGIEPATLWCMR